MTEAEQEFDSDDYYHLPPPVASPDAATIGEQTPVMAAANVDTNPEIAENIRKSSDLKQVMPTAAVALTSNFKLPYG